MNESDEQIPAEYVEGRLDFSNLETPVPRRLYTYKEIGDLHRALKPFLDVGELRQLAIEGGDIYKALRVGEPPRELRQILDTLSVILRPPPREQIRSPSDAAALLMVEMSHLDQEEMRTILLDTKNRVQGIATIYRGTVNTAMIRIGELYKEAIRHNSVAIILAHSHPSGDPQPSPEDILLTRHAVEAGTLLDIECLDHLIIGEGRWVSLRERRLGFSQ